MTRAIICIALVGFAVPLAKVAWLHYERALVHQYLSANACIRLWSVENTPIYMCADPYSLRQGL